MMSRLARRIGWVVVPILLAACSNGRGSLQEQPGEAPPPSPPPPSAPAQATFAVRGSVSGLTGAGLVLQNNGADDLAIGADGTFMFATRLANEAAYSVVVRTPPNGQNCVVQNATGTIAGADVANVAVSCAANQFTISGTVSGLSGRGLELQLNGSGELSVVGDGPFAFSTGLPDGATFTATVLTQPSNPTQECTLANGSGAIAGANVTNLAVACTTRSFTVGGTVEGLAATGLALHLNGTQDLPIMGNGRFTFATPTPSGTSYTVTLTQPMSPPLQVCTAANATGTVLDANVTNVRVACATQTFRVGGTVSGLLGNGLRLRNSNGEVIPVGANGSFAFAREVASGAAYDIVVDSHPARPTQACSVANGKGTIATANVSDVQVNCTTSTFTVGGTIQNLLGSGLILRNNGGDDLTPTASGRFTFATAIASGTDYRIEIAQQPTAPSQTCAIENPTGAVTDGNVTDVRINCTTNGFLIGGTVTGLLGTGLQLQNGAETITIAADGPFRFSTALPFGTPYYVHVLTLPRAPAQGCFVVNGLGLIAGEDITNIEVRCEIAPQF